LEKVEICNPNLPYDKTVWESRRSFERVWSKQGWLLVSEEPEEKEEDESWLVEQDSSNECLS